MITDKDLREQIAELELASAKLLAVTYKTAWKQEERQTLRHVLRQLIAEYTYHLIINDDQLED